MCLRFWRIAAAQNTSQTCRDSHLQVDFNIYQIHTLSRSFYFFSRYVKHCQRYFFLFTWLCSLFCMMSTFNPFLRKLIRTDWHLSITIMSWPSSFGRLKVINKSGEKVNFFAASLQFTSMKYSYNILVNKSGENVNFFAASFEFTRIKYSYNILVSKLGEKVNFFAANF